MTWPFGILQPASFGVIMCDPPWHFEAYAEDSSGVPQRAKEQHYKTMTIEQMALFLPVAKLARADCALLLWSTSSHTTQAFWLAERWGFEFKGKAFCWAKTNPLEAKKSFEAHEQGIYWPVDRGGRWHMGQGYGSRRNTEDCWLFTRGAPERLDAGVRELIVAPRREHSRKPDEAYTRAQRLFAGPYLDMFSRQARPGWSAWGNEEGKFDV